MIGRSREAGSTAVVTIQFKFLATRITRYVFFWIHKDIAGGVMDVLLDVARMAQQGKDEAASGDESEEEVAVRPVKSRAVVASKETTAKKSRSKSKTPTKSSKGAVTVHMTQGTDGLVVVVWWCKVCLRVVS